MLEIEVLAIQGRDSLHFILHANPKNGKKGENT